MGERNASGVTSMKEMSRMSRYFDISKWDVSRVTSMSWMFMGAYSFSTKISKLDVSRVTNMAILFGREVASASAVCAAFRNVFKEKWAPFPLLPSPPPPPPHTHPSFAI